MPNKQDRTDYMRKQNLQKKAGSKPRLRLFCTECGYRFPPDLVAIVNRGEEAYCEQCGTRIAPGKVGSPSQGLGLPREPVAHPRSTGKRPRSPPEGRTFPRTWGRDDTKVEPEPRLHGGDAGARAGGFPGRGCCGRGEQGGRDDLDGAIQAVNSFSVPFGVLVLLASLGTALWSMLRPGGSVDGSALFTFLVTLFLGSAVVHHDAKYFKPKLGTRDYSSRGVDEFVWGVVGCVASGAGALVVLKSILVYAYTERDRSVYPGLSSRKWARIVTGALNEYSWRLCLLVLFPALGLLAFQLATGVPVGESTVVAVVLLGVAAVLDGAVVRPKVVALLNSPAKRQFSPDLGVLALIVGIVGCVGYGAGTLVVLKGVVLLLYSAGAFHGPLGPSMVTTALPGGVPTSPFPGQSRGQPRELASEPAGTPLDSLAPTPAPRLPKPAPPQTTPRPLHATPSTTPKPPPTQQPTSRPRSPHSLEDQEIVKIYLNRVYTVLSAKIRERVQNLSIPDRDKAEILKEFVYLDEAQQEAFLEEFEDLNASVPPEFVGRILRLNLPEDQREKLVEQLEEMDLEEQAEFVAEMERIVNSMT
ncbi:MAG: hypothetical protein ACTSU5_10670 [Promethearchaeota archaeon]